MGGLKPPPVQRLRGPTAISCTARLSKGQVISTSLCRRGTRSSACRQPILQRLAARAVWSMQLPALAGMSQVRGLWPRTERDLNAARNILASATGASARRGAFTSVTPNTREMDTGYTMSGEAYKWGHPLACALTRNRKEFACNQRVAKFFPRSPDRWSGCLPQATPGPGSPWSRRSRSRGHGSVGRDRPARLRRASHPSGQTARADRRRRVGTAINRARSANGVAENGLFDAAREQSGAHRRRRYCEAHLPTGTIAST